MRIITSNIIIKKNKEGDKFMRNMIKYMQVRKDAPNVVTHNMLRDSDVQLASTNVKIAISLVISVTCATRRESLRIKGL